MSRERLFSNSPVPLTPVAYKGVLPFASGDFVLDERAILVETQSMLEFASQFTLPRCK